MLNASATSKVRKTHRLETLPYSSTSEKMAAANKMAPDKEGQPSLKTTDAEYLTGGQVPKGEGQRIPPKYLRAAAITDHGVALISAGGFNLSTKRRDLDSLHR